MSWQTDKFFGKLEHSMALAILGQIGSTKPFEQPPIALSEAVQILASISSSLKLMIVSRSCFGPLPFIAASS